MKFIDFFAGIGGFRLGMEQAGHQCVGHCEIDKYADASYRMMHTVTEDQREYLMTLPLRERQKEIRKEEYINGEWYSDDITRVNAADLPEADCYCGGFPCQAFSIAGQRRGFEDTRGTLFFDIARLAAERQPRLLFLENVKGLLNHEKGNTFTTIISALDSIGYDAEWCVCNSKDFVPQNRERIFIIGYLRGRSRGQIFPLTRADSEDSILRIANIYGAGKGTSYAGNVWDKDHISPALQTMQGGCREPMITEAVPEVKPCLTPGRVEKRQNGRRMKEDGEDMFTLTSQDIHGVAIKDFIDKHNKNAKHQQDLLQHEDDVCRCIPCGTHGSTPHLLKTVVEVKDKDEDIP